MAYKRTLKIHSIQVTSIMLSQFPLLFFYFKESLFFFSLIQSLCSWNATVLIDWKVWWTTSGLMGAEHWMFTSNIKLKGVKKHSDFYSSSWSKYCLLIF